MLRGRDTGPRIFDAFFRAHTAQVGQAAKIHPEPVSLRNDGAGREFPTEGRTGNKAEAARAGAESGPTLALNSIAS